MLNLLDALSDSENTIDLQDENLITPIHEFLEINPEKRLITIPESEKLFGVYGENKVEIKYFKCPRVILNDIDLYECYIFINYISASGKIGYIQADTVVLDETESYIIFTWELTRNVFDENIDTDIYFSISAKQYLEDKEPVFFTRKARGNLYETVYAEEQITEQYADIILQLLAEMDGVKQIATPEAMQEYVNIWLSENSDKLGGQPIPVKSANEMLNTNTIYLYMGIGETINEVVYEKGYIYYYLEEEQSWIKGSFYGGKGENSSFSGSAEDVTYDDTETKLGATNVQDAIKKISDKQKSVVSYDSQSLTDEQKTQARKNIGAISSEDIPKSLPANDVYSWAKEPKKPSYTASEVGALPDTTKIPTNTSDLTNNSGYITKAVNDLANYYLKSQTYSAEEIDNKISSIPKFSIEVVESLPTSNISTTTVYLLKSGEETDNLYTEYIRVNEKWEYLGKQTVDLTGYVKRTELSSYYTKTEIDSLLETIRNSIPSLTGYAKESYVQEYAQPKGNYATSEELEQLEEQIVDQQRQISNLESSILADVLEALGTPIVGSINDDNVVTLSEELSEGTYTLRHIKADEYIDICTFTVSSSGSGEDEPTVTNLLSSAVTPSDLNTIFNGVGYMDGKYASSTSPYYGDDASTFCSGLILATSSSVFYIKGVTINPSTSHHRLGLFSNAGTPYQVKQFSSMTDYATLETLGEQYYKLTLNSEYINTNLGIYFAYIMISAMGSGANCIISDTEIA